MSTEKYVHIKEKLLIFMVSCSYLAMTGDKHFPCKLSKILNNFCHEFRWISPFEIYMYIKFCLLNSKFCCSNFDLYYSIVGSNFGNPIVIFHKYIYISSSTVSKTYSSFYYDYFASQQVVGCSQTPLPETIKSCIINSSAFGFQRDLMIFSLPLLIKLVYFLGIFSDFWYFYMKKWNFTKKLNKRKL